VKPKNQIVTLSGTVYDNVNVEQVCKDGLVISYTLHGGGFGMTKIDTTDLPSPIRQKYKLYSVDTGNQ
jgi:hypothetical protein